MGGGRGRGRGSVQQDGGHTKASENNGGMQCSLGKENPLACAAWLRSEDFAGAGNGVRRENGGRSWVVDELRIVDQGEDLRRGSACVGDVSRMWKCGGDCLAEECDGLLLQLLRVADVAVDDAFEVQAFET